MIPSDCCRDSWGAYLYLAMGLYLYHVSRYITMDRIFIITFIGIRSSAYTIGLGDYTLLIHGPHHLFHTFTIHPSEHLLKHHHHLYNIEVVVLCFNVLTSKKQI